MYTVVRYYVCETTLNSEDIGLYCTYGGCYVTYDKKGNVVETAKIDDISIRKEFVENLVNLLEQHEVSPVHFRDIVEDMICT